MRAKEEERSSSYIPKKVIPLEQANSRDELVILLVRCLRISGKSSLSSCTRNKHMLSCMVLSSLLAVSRRGSKIAMRQIFKF